MSTLTRKQLEQRIAELQLRLTEAEDTLHAIRSGSVDALVVTTPDGEQIFTLRGIDTEYRILVEAMNEGALMLTLDGTVLYTNSRFAVMTGRPLEQVIGSPMKQFFPERQHKDFDALLGKARHGGVSHEFELQLASDQTRPVWISLAYTHSVGIEGFSAVVTDLTERKAAEAKVNEMAGELEGVSYAIVHDMRAPLRAMEAFAYMLGQDSANDSSERRKDLARRITTAAARLDELIRDALAYNKLVLQPTHFEPVNLQQLLRDLFETYPNLGPDKAEIQIEQMPMVLGNQALLTQCFANLLGNAVKFVPKGVRPKIRVHAEYKKDMARIWIEDNGIGIPPNARERLFRIFQRLTPDYEGTGIGLAIVRKAVERMGGTVGVESEVGKGSRFWVELHAIQQETNG